MKDMHKVFGVLLPCLLILASGCVKEKSFEEKYRPAGTPIKFSATSEYENGDDTRTEYSGVIFDETVGATTRHYERIDWVANDPMTILYVNGSASLSSASYKINNDIHHEDTKESMATISANPSGSDLVWGESAGHTFYAMYPSTGYGNTGASLTETQQGDFRVQGIIPATQLTKKKTVNSTDKYLPNMDNGFMVAYANIPSGSTQTTVTLPFTPAVTAFEFMFKLKTNADSYKIRQFRLKSASSTNYPLTGTFAFNITGGDSNGATWNKAKTSDYTGTKITNPGDVITVTFDTDRDGTADDVTMSSNTVFDFTLFALPINLSQLTMEIVYENGTVKSLPLKQTISGTETWASFAATKKYRITNYVVPNEQGAWTYTIETINSYSTNGHAAVSYPVTIKSYKTSAKNPNDKVAVPWKAQYSTDNGATWSDATTTQFGSSVTGNGGGTGESRTAKLAGDSPSSSITLRQKDIDAMKARTPSASTKSGAYDLSKQPRYGILDTSVPTQTTRHTANCYVVSRPGWYKFPCVYGNAISGGDATINTSAFAPIDVSATDMSAFVDDAHPLVYWTSNFRNALNNNITNPWIPDDVSSASSLTAKIVWQDSEIVPDNSSYLSYDSKYIYFYITTDKIAPGSVIIALTGAVNGATKTLWSWHIWVTNKDLTPVTIGGKSMMDYNLGWMDTADVTETTYGSRSLQFRIIQTETNGNAPAVYKDFTVSQSGGDVVYNKANIGTNPYYQWGRKDPIIPATSNSADKSVTKGSAGSNTTSNTHNLQYLPYDIHSVSEVYDPYYIYCSNADGQQGGTHWGTDADYSVGIQEPYHPILNSYTTGWVGGPFITHGVAEGTYLHGVTGFTEDDVANYATNNYSLGFRLSQFTFYWFNSYWYILNETYPYDYNQVTSFVDNYNLQLNHFYPNYHASDYISREQQRLENCSVASNLWNAVCYSNDVTVFGQDGNQYKTIYDPCPPGFMVPSGAAFNDFPNPVSHTLSGASSADGVTFDGHFFPFTGARVYHSAGNATSWAEDPYHWDGANVVSLSRNSIGSGSYLWVSEHTNISPKMPSKTDPGKFGGVYRYYNINRDTYYSGFDKASFMSFSSSAVTKPNSAGGMAGYTMGTAASIRPAVDPKY